MQASEHADRQSVLGQTQRPARLRTGEQAAAQRLGVDRVRQDGRSVRAGRGEIGGHSWRNPGEASAGAREPSSQTTSVAAEHAELMGDGDMPGHRSVPGEVDTCAIGAIAMRDQELHGGFAQGVVQLRGRYELAGSLPPRLEEHRARLEAEPRQCRGVSGGRCLGTADGRSDTAAARA